MSETRTLLLYIMLFFTSIMSCKPLAAVSPEAQTYYDTSVAALVESPKCLSCHVSGGAAGHTALVFIQSGTNKNAQNSSQFNSIISPFNSQYVLNKIKGINHGGAEQYSEFTPAYQNFVTFFNLLEINYVDDDGDGIVNASDQCPNTPAGRVVDSVGCEISSTSEATRFMIPGSFCHAAEPGVSIKLQSKETGIINTSTKILQVICPIPMEIHNEESSNVVDWITGISAYNETEQEFALSCGFYEMKGYSGGTSTEKTQNILGKGSAILRWPVSLADSVNNYVISCALPSGGVIRAIQLKTE